MPDRIVHGYHRRRGRVEPDAICQVGGAVTIVPIGKYRVCQSGTIVDRFPTIRNIISSAVSADIVAGENISNARVRKPDIRRMPRLVRVATMRICLANAVRKSVTAVNKNNADASTQLNGVIG